MAVLNSTIAYTGRKKLGTVVVRTVRGQLIASQHQPHVRNPKTAGQVEQRQKMAATVKAYKSVQPATQVGMLEINKHGSKYNKFVQINIEASTYLVGGVWEINYELIQISHGSLTTINDISAGIGGGGISFDYTGSATAGSTNSSDEIVGAVVIPEFQDAQVVDITTRGVDGTAAINLSYLPSGVQIFVYAFPTNTKKKRAGATQFLGVFTTP